MTRAGRPVQASIAAAPASGCVRGAPAGHQLDPGDRPERRLEAVELARQDPVLAAHPAGDRLGERLGLLVDLLEHEVS